jgi:hypothetical protein
MSSCRFNPMRHFLKLVCAVALLLTAISPIRAQTNTLVVPSDLANNYGSIGDDPLFYGSVQLIYGSAEFEAAPTDIIEITGFSWRVDDASSESLDITIPAMKLILGAYPGPPSGISDFFQQNLGPNPVTVLFTQNPVHLVAERGLGFNAHFAFQTPFFYDRRVGPLVMQIGSATRFGSSFGFDAEDSSENVLLYQEPIDGRLVKIGETLVTEFSYLPVPEPAPLLVALLGTLLLFWRRE